MKNSIWKSREELPISKNTILHLAVWTTELVNGKVRDIIVFDDWEVFGDTKDWINLNFIDKKLKWPDGRIGYGRFRKDRSLYGTLKGWALASEVFKALNENS